MIPLRSEPNSPDDLRVFKYHALGNSYLVLDPRDNKRLGLYGVERADGSVVPSTELVSWLCDQSRGIGSNGLLFGPTKVVGSKQFGLSIINSDGSYAGFSGNGIRIFARYLLDAGYVEPGALISVQTVLEENIDAPRVAPIRIGDAGGRLIDVTLPYPPRFGPDAVEANRSSISSVPEDARSCVHCGRSREPWREPHWRGGGVEQQHFRRCRQSALHDIRSQSRFSPIPTTTARAGCGVARHFVS